MVVGVGVVFGVVFGVELILGVFVWVGRGVINPVDDGDGVTVNDGVTDGVGFKQK